ncbi:uncharacterized protein LOC126805512 isoform X2 [Argentina anserina]|uniref:uncharacterized protein LOC126805512 isoform X2 n=1 Tax=Argentina anserina TaxID=57926 RepID=UPI0021765B96|nr:uncharacterized protein LOC126805512 isoform X2 [Potentilla anserina]
MKSDLMMTEPSPPSDRSTSPAEKHRCRNVVSLIKGREISPRAKHLPRSLWKETPKVKAGSSSAVPECQTTLDAKRGLLSWVEAASLRQLSARYCNLVPPPRSTIAAAFSPDGRMVASTHGDHTVKIIDCQTGRCLKVLSGHRRTPWVVRFHPSQPEIIASGGLDHEVRLWDLDTSECIGSRDFHRPIASMAFHATGELLVVASGHKVYVWNYKKLHSSPDIILKTSRSLRAVHFHPQAAPFLLTAEVNDLDSSDPFMTPATSSGYSQYPSPAVFMANVHSNEHLSLAAELPHMSLPFVFVSQSVDDPRIELRGDVHVGSSNVQVTSTLRQFESDVNATEQRNSTVSPMESFPSVPSFSHLNDAMETNEMHAVGQSQPENSISVDAAIDRLPENISIAEPRQLRYIFHYRDPAFWELPFLQAMQGSTSLSGVSRGAGLHFRFSVPESGDSAAIVSALHNGNEVHPIISRIHSEVTTSLAATAAAELPCTVKLSVWLHDIKSPSAPLTDERCRLTIPHAVLCSEMGTHFSPCGRFLAACVACMLPDMEAEPGLQSVVHQDSGIATSPTRHPISAHQVIYELRIYSLEEATFGLILASRAIRAAHCLTSIQFSPTSEHILIAYGRRHGSLLKSIVIDGESTVPIYTVLEVYRVSDMELVKVLPSADDEVNVACFHPFAGGGLAYGTKEGKLRVLQFDSVKGRNCFTEENMAFLV